MVTKVEEELAKEKAETLGRAAKKVENVLEEMEKIFQEIEALKISDSLLHGEKIIARINEKVEKYNALREEAKIYYFYLLVTREALGLYNHNWVEVIYSLPKRLNPFNYYG